MKKIKDLKVIQKRELEILKAFDGFCNEYQLTYLLYGGTLLGAVQFNGFIPWDDDIDVVMPRPDYEKFIELTKGKLGEEYAVLSTKHNSNYAFPFVKIVDNKTVMYENGIRKKYSTGLYIDVYPLDGCPVDISGRRRHFKGIQIYINILDKIKSTYKGRTIIRTFARIMVFSPFRILNPQLITEKIDKTAKKYPFSDCEYIAVTVWRGAHNCGDAFKKEDYMKRIKFKFENAEFWGTQDYDNCLTLFYGDYKKLPPKEKQISHHKSELYMKDSSCCNNVNEFVVKRKI